jgi:hypothetical protein
MNKDMKVFKYSERRIVLLHNCRLAVLMRWDPRQGDWKSNHSSPYSPGVFCPEDPKDYGYLIYLGVVIRFGKSGNTTVLDLIDSMNIHTRDRLIGAWEVEDGWNFLWKEFVPKSWKCRRVLETSNGDLCAWNVGSNDKDGQDYCYDDRAGGKCVSNCGGRNVCYYE